MDRLIFTDQKTSSSQGAAEPAGIRGRKSLIIEYAKYVITGAIMGIGAFMVFKTQFGLKAGGGIMSGSFTGGMVRSWNQIASTLAGRDGVFLDQLEGASRASGQFLMMVLIFSIIVGILIARSRNKWFILIYPLLFLPMTIGFGLSASVLSIAVLALGIVLFMAVCPGKQEFTGRWRWSRMAYALAATGLALVIICVPVVSKIADKPNAVQNIDDKASKSIVSSYYGETPLGEGDLSRGKRNPGKGVAMTVDMSTPQSIYLRGYVGDVLDGLKWQTLSYSTYYEERDLIYWLNDYGFNGLGQIGQAARLAEFDPLTTSDVTIEVDKASRRYAYVPYEIDEDGVEDAKNWNDSFVTATRGARLSEYSYTMGANAVNKWTSVAGKIFTLAENMDVSSYMELESYYNTHVYENYLFISDDDAMALERYVGDKGDQSRGHIEYNTAISMVKNTLATYMVYDERPGKLKGKRSAVKSLFRAGVGYDVHYASLATLLFRYYGIPARYVEGYLITPQDVADNPDGTFHVKQGSAHAWTEIYVDGVGFVPIETCPEYAGMMEEADFSIGISNKSVDDNFDDNQAEGLTPEDNFKDSNKGVGKTASKILMIVGGILALALLVLLGYLVWRVVRKKLAFRKRKQFFKNGETREAVRDMYRYMDEIEYKPDEMTTEIGNRASYSTHQVTDHDREVMLAVLSGAKKKVRAEKKKKREAEKRARRNEQAEKNSNAGTWNNIRKKFHRSGSKNVGSYYGSADTHKEKAKETAGAAKAGKFGKILPKRSGKKGKSKERN